MKRSQFLKLLVFVLILAFAMPAFAYAKRNVKFTNNTGRQVSFALRYKDEASGNWITRGWYNVGGHSSRTISLSTNNNVAYWFGYAGTSWWGGQAGASTTKSYTVVNDKFAVTGNNKPNGTNRRTVNFKEVRAQNGQFSISIK